MEGQLGFSNIRGRQKNSYEAQLGRQVKSKIHYNSEKTYEELLADYTHVVLATGDSDYAKKTRNFREDLTVSVKGATIEGSFDPYEVEAWLDYEIAPFGYGYLIPYSEKEANLVGLIPAPASAASKGSHIFVDGVPLNSRSVSKNGVSFVPFRELFEKLKMNIGYDAKLKQVTGTKGDLKITFSIGSKTAYVNGQKKALQAAPFAQNGTTLIPVRIVGEATGNAVYYSAAADVIQINSPSFKGASYTIDGIPILFNANGTVLFGPDALKDMNQQKEIAEIDAIKEFTANAPKIRVVGVPPTQELYVK